jgi:hypothetical protein
MQHIVDIIIATRDAFKQCIIADAHAASTSPKHHRKGLQLHGHHQQNNLVNTPSPLHCPQGWAHTL